MKEVENIKKELEKLKKEHKDKWVITYSIKVFKKCYKCGTTEATCPDFYKTKDTKENICGDCFGMKD